MNTSRRANFPPNLLSRQFDRARLKLSLLYLALCGLIVLIFSVAALNAQRYAVNQVVTTLRATTAVAEQRVIDEVLDQALARFDTAFQERLILVNVVLLLVAGILSYILSGYSLRSVRENLENQQEFAADASHELRTPLTTISMEIVALQKTHKRLPRPVKETLQSIQQEVRRMQQIVNGLLTLVRNDRESGAGWVVTDLNQVVTESVKQMQTLAAAKEVALQCHSAPGKLPVRVIPDQLKQVCLILLDNAIKYTPAQGTVTIDTSIKGRGVYLTVEDTGVGIPESELPLIFDRFYRVKGLDRTGQKGAGLGLTIAHKLIETARGTIRVSSTIGIGSRFVIRLPRAS